MEGASARGVTGVENKGIYVNGVGLKKFHSDFLLQNNNTRVKQKQLRFFLHYQWQLAPCQHNAFINHLILDNQG